MATVLSPHLDDAVLSAATRLMRGPVRVVTVFAGAPPYSLELTAWERLTRARSSWERHRERLDEDRGALALLGCTPLHLDEREKEHREGEANIDVLSMRLDSVLENETEIWIPAGLGGHPDHIATRDAVLRLQRDADIFLYADLPYAMRYGWPTWVTGVDAPEFLDPDAWLAGELTRRGLDPASLTPSIVALSPEERDRKARAVRSYRTQLPALGIGPDQGHDWETFLRYELAWRCRLPWS